MCEDNARDRFEISGILAKYREADSGFFFDVFSSAEELLHALITDAEAWPKMLADGATTSFEGWCRESKWNTSLFHLTLSDAAAFLADFRPGDAFHFDLPKPIA